MGIFGKPKRKLNDDVIDSSKCNFLLSNGLCGMTTYGVVRRCAKEQCILMKMLREPLKNMDYNPEELELPPEKNEVHKQADEMAKNLSKPMFGKAEVAYTSAENPCKICGKDIEKNLPNKEQLHLCRECRKKELENQMKLFGVTPPK